MDACKKIESVMADIEDACRRVGRDPSEVTLLGASKTVPPEVIKEFYRCGLRCFGENKAQEFLAKYEALEGLEIDWHFIGRLQTNKVKYLIGRVSLIHSLDRKPLADEIQKRAQKRGAVQDVLIEVNVGGEESKGGVEPERLKELYEYARGMENLRVIGLMTIPPYFENPEEVRPYFVRLRELRDQLEEEFGEKLPHLSMGMSHDFKVAVEEGATIVRIGTRLFGERT